MPSDGNDGFEAPGEWWLPLEPERKVSGTLSFSPEQGARLDLIGTFGSPFPNSSADDADRPGTYARIHGLAEGAAYTLEDCFTVTLTHQLLSLQGVESIHVNNVLKGAYFEEGEALEASGIRFGVRHIAEWVNETGITETVARPQNPPEARALTVTGTALPDKEFTRTNGAALYLRHSLNVSGNVLTARSVAQDFYFQIDYPGLRPLDHLLRESSYLRDLVSNALDRPAPYTFTRFVHPDIYHQVSDERRIPESIDYYVQSLVRDPAPTKKVNPFNVFFTLETLGGIQVVGRWGEVAATHHTALGRVMATRYSREMFISDKLLHCAAAIESLDRTETDYKNTPFKSRLKRSVANAGPPFEELVADVDSWAEKVRWHRDDVAHNYGREMYEDRLDRLYLTDSLYWLFVLCMLRQCGADGAVFGRFPEQSRVKWLRPRLQSVL